MRTTKDVFGHRELWAAALLAVASGCTGTASLTGNGVGSGAAGAAGSNGGAGGSSSTGNGSGNGNGNGNPSQPGTAPSTGAAGTLGNVPAGGLDSGRVALRRLNVREYDNTMRDLLGTQQTLAADTFPSDNVDDYFDTVGSALSYSDLLIKQQYAAAGTLVTELMARTATDPLYTAVFVCTPTATNLATCLPQILTSFMPKAWRRPVTATEVSTAAAVGTTIYASATASTATAATGTTAATGADSPVTTAVASTLEYVLTSPNFLYRVELGNPVIVPSSSATTPLSDYEAATRLSYFLWSSMPDATLTQAAAAGQLVSNNGAGIPAQITRMIADPKFTGFTTGFVDQWVQYAYPVSGVAPDPTMFPTNSDAAFLASILPESEAFVNYLITSQAPLTEFLSANYTFVNGRLAQFYGISGVPSTQTTFTKVSAAPNRNAGFLTQETFLTTTSLATRTSPVHRGAYILSQLVCDPPQPPPPNVPALNAPAAGSGLTVRQALDEHASNPSCAGCHSLIDPAGYPFENFDATGAYRTTDNMQPIDASGSLYGASGTVVQGAPGMAQAIAADPRFVECVVKQAMTYGVGRTFDAADGLGYVETVAQPLLKGGTWVSALQAVATSQAFLTTRGGQ